MWSAEASEPVPRTRAPERTSSWVRIVPTPPPAAPTSTTSPGPAASASATAQAVRPATSTTPAVRSATPSGVRWMRGSPSASTMWSARARPRAPPYTRSPTAQRVVSGPIASTTPAKSLPYPEGRDTPNADASSGDATICQSTGFSPATVTRTRMSDPSGAGTGRSAMPSTSGPPNASCCTNRLIGGASLMHAATGPDSRYSPVTPGSCYVGRGDVSTESGRADY